MMSLYLNIWLHPIKTITDAVANENKKPVPFLPILILGISTAIDMSPDFMHLLNIAEIYWALLATFPITLVFILLIFRLVFPFLIRIVGLLWKGVASHKQLAKACSIALLPYSLILISQVIILLSDVMINSETFDFSARAVITFWSFVLLVIGVAKSQQFTYGFAVLNILLCYLPLILLSLLRI